MYVYTNRKKRPAAGLWLLLAAIVLTALFALETLPDCQPAQADGSDVAVRAGDTHLTPLPAIRGDCPFSHGWNLTVLNGTPDMLPDCVKVVWRYEGSEDRWYFWGRANAPYWNDLTSFSMEKGYWVWAVVTQ